MIDLKNYKNEILAIGAENNMGFDVAVHMFVANIQNVGDEALPHYAGADVDYAALKPEWDVMGKLARADAINDFVDFMRK